MSTYADASVIVALFVPDIFSERALAFVQEHRPTMLVSDFAAAEFASVLARRVRERELEAETVRGAFTAFDKWVAIRGERLGTSAGDVAVAEGFLRRLDLNLRAPDALNIAIAERHNAALATFDVRMAQAAQALGLEIAPA